MRSRPLDKPIIPLENVTAGFPAKWLPKLIEKHWRTLNETYGELIPLRLGAGRYGVVFAVKGQREVVKITSDADEVAITHRILSCPELRKHPGVVRVDSVLPLFESSRTRNKAWVIYEELLLPLQFGAEEVSSWHWPLVPLVNGYNAATCNKPWGNFWNQERYARSVVENIEKLAKFSGAGPAADFLLRFWQAHGVFLEDVHLGNMAQRVPYGPYALFDLRIHGGVK